jgi:threonine/homoserine/homoserine lactone efflux protein
MPPVSSLLLAALTGLVSGLLLSIPIGPINLTIVNEGARRGFVWAALIGLGATVMEVIYCFIAFTSLATFFTNGLKHILGIFTFFFILYLGLKFLRARAPEPLMLGKTAERIEARIEKRLHPHSAFMTGIVRVMGNVGVLVFWVILAAKFMSNNWVTPTWPGKCACVAGVGLGTGLWFLFLSWLVARRRAQFSEKTLLRMEHISGFVLLGLAALDGVSVVWGLCAHR